MKPILLKRAGWVAGILLAASATVWFAWRAPVGVDLAIAARGPMEVTVDDDGKTQVAHVYAVSAPIAGKVLRISHPDGTHAVSRHVGDQAIANETVIAVMQPTVPSFIDSRSRGQLEAELVAAEAFITQGEAEVRRLEAALAFSRHELQRAEALARTQNISAQAVDKARFEVDTNEAALASAKAQVDLRRSLRSSAAARLMDPSSMSALADGACCVQIRAPVTGRILKIIQESEAVVQTGTPLMEIGDPLDLEIVVDLLSTDAVQIQPGAMVRIDGWGGPPLQGRVRRIDPAGFLKVSALGIEEQRVRTTIDRRLPRCLVAPGSRFSRDDACYGLAERQRSCSPDWRALSQGRRLGRIHGARRPGTHRHCPGWPPQQSPGRDSRRLVDWRGRDASPKRPYHRRRPRCRKAEVTPWTVALGVRMSWMFIVRPVMKRASAGELERSRGGIGYELSPLLGAHACDCRACGLRANVVRNRAGSQCPRLDRTQRGAPHPVLGQTAS